MPALVVSPVTALALRALLRKTPDGGQPDDQGGEVSRLNLLVRCTSSTAAAGSGIGAECYPAVVVDPVSDELLADQPELGTMWLTLTDGSVPTADTVYHGIMSGEHTEGSDTRPRVFAAPGGSGGGDLESGQTTYESSYSITADSVWEDTGFDLSLPSAGTYLIVCRYMTSLRVSAITGPATSAAIGTRFWDETAGAVIANTSMLAAHTDQLNTTHVNYITHHMIVTVDEPSVIRIEAFRSTLATWVGSVIGGSTFSPEDGTVLSYIKLAGGGGGSGTLTLDDSGGEVDYDISVDATWEDTGHEVFIPADGDTVVGAFVSALAEVSSIGSTIAPTILARLYDDDAAAQIGRIVHVVSVPIVDVEMRGSVSFQVTDAFATPGNTVKLQVYRTSSSWTTARIGADGTAGVGETRVWMQTVG